jgi:transcriptional regulator with XRE-family HTH domain
MQDSELDLGTRLREARLHRGWTLREVAASTKIPVDWIAAIERNEFDLLPEGIFRRSYVRAFAAEVGVRAEPFPEALLQNPEIGRIASRDVGEGTSRHNLSMVLTILLLSTIWALARTTGNSAPDIDGTGPSASNIATSTRLDVASETGDAAHAADSVPPQAGASLTMRFLGPCWISATADGRRVVHRLVAEGERLEIEGQDSISIEIGDAGAVLGSINGSSPRVLGADSEVLRMELTPSELVGAGADI